MKRDWDVVRKILLAVEALPDEASQLNTNEMVDIDKENAAYHMRLLIEAKMVEGACRNSLGPVWCYATRLTWEGHEFLDSIRQETIWNRVKLKARERGVDLSFDIIKTAAKALIASIMV